MKQWSVFMLGFVFAATIGLALPVRASVFINEIHYDNTGTDEFEGVEIAGRAGTDLAGWLIKLYNGDNGEVYKTVSLSGILPDQQNGHGVLHFFISAMQNGPDGMALVDNTDSVVQFLSYEGSFEAADGPASGLMSDDIDVFEMTTTPLNYSLQLAGKGTLYEDFSWINNPIAHTRGEINTGQSFVPIPGAVWLLGSSLLGLGIFRRRRQQAKTLTASM